MLETACENYPALFLFDGLVECPGRARYVVPQNRGGEKFIEAKAKPLNKIIRDRSIRPVDMPVSQS